MAFESNHVLGCHGTGAMAMPILALMRTKHILMMAKPCVSFLMILAVSLSDGVDTHVHSVGHGRSLHPLQRSPSFCLLVALK